MYSIQRWSCPFVTGAQNSKLYEANNNKNFFYSFTFDMFHIIDKKASTVFIGCMTNLAPVGSCIFSHNIT